MWRFRCRGSASLRCHKARFRARELGQELGTKSESPGGQFSLAYYKLISVVSFLYYVNAGTSPQRAGSGSSRRGIPDPERDSRRAGRGAARDRAVPLRSIDTKASDAKDRPISL